MFVTRLKWECLQVYLPFTNEVWSLRSADWHDIISLCTNYWSVCICLQKQKARKTHGFAWFMFLQALPSLWKLYHASDICCILSQSKPFSCKDDTSPLNLFLLCFTLLCHWCFPFVHVFYTSLFASFFGLCFSFFPMIFFFLNIQQNPKTNQNKCKMKN